MNIKQFFPLNVTIEHVSDTIDDCSILSLNLKSHGQDSLWREKGLKTARIMRKKNPFRELIMGNTIELTKARWVDVKGGQKEDSHAELKDSFVLQKAQTLHLVISCDSDYAFYLNGSLISFSSYSDYPSHRVGDEVDFDCLEGLNSIKILTYYCGSSTFFTYSPGPSGLIYEIKDGKNVLACSGENTLGRLSKCYENGLCKRITPQLGYSYRYDARAEDDDSSWEKSEVSSSPVILYRRENKKCVLGEPVPSQLTRLGKGHYLADLKEETVGLLYLSFVSPLAQKAHISYGEHLENGEVVEIIDNRDFGFDYFAKAGKNEFLPFRPRLGARYLELVFEEDVKDASFSIRPVNYPFEEIPYVIDNPLRQRIYDLSLKTLKCCYHEHYEDCPWREQSLYILDSANQMRFGFYCFNNPEAAHSSFALILRGERQDGLLPICAPTSFDFVIPSFNLKLFGAIEEYVAKTHDIAFLKESYPRMEKVMNIGQ